MVLEALGLDLMAADDELESISAHEGACLLDAEVVRALPCVVGSPPFSDLVLGIAPEQVAEHSLDGDLLEPIDQLYLLHFVEVWRDASMHCEIFLVDQCRHWEQVEQSHNILVSALIVLVEAWVIGSLHSYLKLNMEVIVLHSWLPLSRWIASGYFSFMNSSSVSASMLKAPRST